MLQGATLHFHEFVLILVDLPEDNWLIFLPYRMAIYGTFDPMLRKSEIVKLKQQFFDLPAINPVYAGNHIPIMDLIV